MIHIEFKVYIYGCVRRIYLYIYVILLITTLCKHGDVTSSTCVRGNNESDHNILLTDHLSCVIVA